MGDGVKVQGRKLLDLFNTLIEKQVIISMNVVGADYDRLTCVTDWVKTPEGNHLIIDAPDDFKATGEDNHTWHLRFNFNGPDRLEYLFSTRGGDVCEQGIRVPFPDYVERLQRRRNFRVGVQTGTQMSFQLKKIEGILDLINVSLGGAYGVLIKHNFKFMRGPVLKMDQQVLHSRIVFPGDNAFPGDTIHIKRAEVRRIEHDQESGFYRYALEFKALEQEEKKKLTQVIYDLQRRYLRYRK